MPASALTGGPSRFGMVSTMLLNALLARPVGHQHADHREVARRVGVDEMHLHREARAVDGVLARAVEMELHQPEVSAARRRIVLPSPMLTWMVWPLLTIVSAVLRPGDLERRQLRLDGLADVDRRLLDADRARPCWRDRVRPTCRARQRPRSSSVAPRRRSRSDAQSGQSASPANSFRASRRCMATSGYRSLVATSKPEIAIRESSKIADALMTDQRLTGSPRRCAQSTPRRAPAGCAPCGPD